MNKPGRGWHQLILSISRLLIRYLFHDGYTILQPDLRPICIHKNGIIYSNYYQYLLPSRMYIAVICIDFYWCVDQLPLGMYVFTSTTNSWTCVAGISICIIANIVHILLMTTIIHIHCHTGEQYWVLCKATIHCSFYSNIFQSISLDIIYLSSKHSQVADKLIVLNFYCYSGTILYFREIESTTICLYLNLAVFFIRIRLQSSQHEGCIYTIRKCYGHF